MPFYLQNNIPIESNDSVTRNIIISIKEAKKLLGADAHNLSDSQVKELIVALTTVAEDYLLVKGSKV